MGHCTSPGALPSADRRFGGDAKLWGNRFEIMPVRTEAMQPYYRADRIHTGLVLNVVYPDRVLRCHSWVSRLVFFLSASII